MRFSRLIILVILLIGTFTISLQAQRSKQQKIGLIDSDYILGLLPEYKGLDQTLNQMTIQWEQEIEEERKELALLEKDFEAKRILYTDEIIKQVTTEIEAKKKKIAQLNNQRFGPDGDYFKEQRRLLEPIQRRVFETITIVANREDYDMIFDRSGEMIVMFTRAEWDISDLVLLELGIDTQQSSN
jgi:outer membrane protein